MVQANISGHVAAAFCTADRGVRRFLSFEVAFLLPAAVPDARQ